jgi:hypothetical protein
MGVYVRVKNCDPYFDYHVVSGICGNCPEGTGGFLAKESSNDTMMDRWLAGGVDNDYPGVAFIATAPSHAGDKLPGFHRLPV